jgi:ribosomal protein S12 methylthiotransferase
MAKKQKISILTLGCSKNLVDSERIIASLNDNYQYVEYSEETEILAINTCGFIQSAKEENVQEIVNAAYLKQSKELKKLIVFGCLTERYGKEIKSQINGIDAIFGANDLESVVNYLNKTSNSKLSANRYLLTPKHYAYLKISEGCSRKCSFCSIPIIRGNHKSVEMDTLIDEALSLADSGVKELIVIAQDTTFYGMDIYGKRQLPALLEKLSDLKRFDWIRLMYAYPTGFPPEVLDIMAERDNICKYIDIPLQHISDDLLKSMNRGIDRAGTISLVETIRKKIPEITIRSTFIVGYPGETNSQFNDLVSFIKDYELNRVGCFSYSPEEGTGAFLLKDNVKPNVKAKRLETLMLAQQEISLKKNKELVGKKVKVMLDYQDENKNLVGRTMADAPEVDNLVIIESSEKEVKFGDIYSIDIGSADEYDLYGTIA